jgi:CheY-like chemotaxis protein
MPFEGQGHVALFCDDEVQRNTEIVRFISEGLEQQQLCILGTIHYRDTEYFIRSFANKISEYEENVKNGNLLVVDFAPFYVAALCGDITPYQQVQKQLEELLKEKKYPKVRYVGDATGFLFTNGHFERCKMVEEWWQKVRPENVATLCLFQRPLLERYPYADHKNIVYDTHDLIAGSDMILHRRAGEPSDRLAVAIDLKDEQINHQHSPPHQIRMLIVEPDRDTRYIYERFLGGLGINCTIVSDGASCLDIVSCRHDMFDLVMLDTHVMDLDFIRLATKIREHLPNQKILITSTSRLDGRRKDALAVGIEDEDLLLKPFKFTQFLSVLRSKEFEKSSAKVKPEK